METGSMKFKTCSKTRLKTHVADNCTFHWPLGSVERTEPAALEEDLYRSGAEATVLTSIHAATKGKESLT